MIDKVVNKEDTKICDEFLTKLIQDERKYDSTIDENFIVKDYFINIINSSNNMLFLYKINNLPVGYIYAKESDNGYIIDGLYVLEEYRNQAIASELLNHVINEIKKTNAKYIDINVMYQNELAINLYKKIGFEKLRLSMRKEI